MKTKRKGAGKIMLAITVIVVMLAALDTASATIYSGSSVIGESECFNFGTGDIYWSVANKERGYFYGPENYSNPMVYFADKIEDYWGSYDSYEGVQHIWEFTNANDHEWFTQHAITFAEETSPYYTGILLIKQGDLYGAIRPKSICNENSDHPSDYMLEYDWWYDDSGNSDFSSLKPKLSVTISADKTIYIAGEIMLINITLNNPTENWQPVYFAWRLDFPDYDLEYWIMAKEIYLPPDYKQTFIMQMTLPDIEFWFNASWYVALFNTTTHGVISEDTANWEYIPSETPENNGALGDITEKAKEAVENIKLPN